MARPPSLILALLLVSSAAAQIGTPSIDDPLPEAPSIPDAPAKSPTPDSKVAATAPVVERQEAGTHSIAFQFDLPLRDGRDFSLRAADGSIHHEVSITATRSDGAAIDGAVLELDSQAGRLQVPADQIDGAVANFVLDDATLLRHGSNAWTIRLHQPGEIDLWSSYSKQGSNPSLATRSDGTPVRITDSDGDGWANDIDNCRDAANDQSNMDGDLHGDACDSDIDGDGASNDAEATARSDPHDPASTPDDPDADGHNNTAEAAAGSDPHNAASTPEDPDADGHTSDVETASGSDPHNAASTPHDPDADGLEQDNCPMDANPGQEDVDADGIGDACDGIPNDGPRGDHDGDGVLNVDDNCHSHPNPDQANTDGDHLGDRCDNDKDGDGHVDAADEFPLDGKEWSDHDQDGVGDNTDSDDDNDGLSDDAEIAGGTDPLDPDTDGDLYSDLDELRLGSDPLVHHDPAYLPTGAEAELVDGRVQITWAPRDDGRISHYVVWVKEDLRIVGIVQHGDAPSLVDGSADGNATYAVQAILTGHGFEPRSDRSIDAPFILRGSLAESQGSDGNGPAAPGAETAAPELAPQGEDAPGPAIAGMAALLLVGAALRRLRRA